jgi:hypothetical protein
LIGAKIRISRSFVKWITHAGTAVGGIVGLSRRRKMASPGAALCFARQ